MRRPERREARLFCCDRAIGRESGGGGSVVYLKGARDGREVKSKRKDDLDTEEEGEGTKGVVERCD